LQYELREADGRPISTAFSGNLLCAACISNELDQTDCKAMMQHIAIAAGEPGLAAAGHLRVIVLRRFRCFLSRQAAQLSQRNRASFRVILTLLVSVLL